MSRSVDLTAYDVETVPRVFRILSGIFSPLSEVNDAMGALQNAGILFRERVYDEERVPFTEVPREVKEELAELRELNKLMSVSLSTPSLTTPSPSLTTRCCNLRL